MTSQPRSETIKQDFVTIFVFCIFVASLIYYISNTFDGEENADTLAPYKHKVKTLTEADLIVSMPKGDGQKLLPPMKRSLFE